VGTKERSDRQGFGTYERRSGFAAGSRSRIVEGTELALEVEYRGGLVAYLNGQEIARQHLPARTLAEATAGAVYPVAAYLDRSGQPIGRNTDKAEATAAESARNRRAGPVALPLSALRKGSMCWPSRSDAAISGPRPFQRRGPTRARKCRGLIWSSVPCGWQAILTRAL